MSLLSRIENPEETEFKRLKSKPESPISKKRKKFWKNRLKIPISFIVIVPNSEITVTIDKPRLLILKFFNNINNHIKCYGTDAFRSNSPGKDVCKIYGRGFPIWFCWSTMARSHCQRSRPKMQAFRAIRSMLSKAAMRNIMRLSCANCSLATKAHIAMLCFSTALLPWWLLAK